MSRQTRRTHSPSFKGEGSPRRRSRRQRTCRTHRTLRSASEPDTVVEETACGEGIADYLRCFNQKSPSRGLTTERAMTYFMKTAEVDGISRSDSTLETATLLKVISMKNIYLFSTLIIGLFFIVPYSYSQVVEKQPIVQLYIGSDYNKSFYYSPFDDIEYDLRSVYNYYNPVFGADIKLFTGFNFVFQVNGYSFEETFMDYEYNIKMRRFMAGFKLKDSGRPFYIRILSGMNRTSYDFYNIDQSIFMPKNHYSIGGDVGFTLMKYKYVSLDVSTGLIRSFDSDNSYSNIYLQVYTSISLFSK